VIFEADYDEIELQNIVMTSFPWRHHHYVTKKRHQNNVTNFFQFELLPISSDIEHIRADCYYLFQKLEESRKIMQFQVYLYILKSGSKWKGEWTGWSPGLILTSLYSEDWL